MTGYTIYYQQDGGERSSVSAGASDITATISGLIEGATYFITIVATSNTLPSTVTGPQNITIGTYYSMCSRPRSVCHQYYICCVHGSVAVVVMYARVPSVLSVLVAISFLPSPPT